MIDISTSDPIDSIIKALGEFPAKVARPSIVRALNRAATSTRKLATKEIKDGMGLKAGEVKKAIELRKATGKHLAALLRNRGKRLNLARFSAKQTKRGVRAKAYGVSRVYRGAFMGNSNRTVFARTSKKRLPIRPLVGPGVAQTVIDNKVYEFLQPETLAVFKKELQRELKFRMERLARKGAPPFKRVA